MTKTNMIKMITATLLSLSVNSAFAGGFEPWAGRGHDAPDATPAATTIETFYRHGIPNVRDSVDDFQRDVVIVPWYFQGKEV